MPIGLCEDYPEASRSPEAVRQDMQLMRRTGIRLLRVSIPWDAVEPEKDRYEWGFWDQLLAIAETENVRLIPYVAYTPRWNARPDIAAFWTSPPRDPAEFAELMDLLAARYRGRIHSWEIWNEPDNHDFWSGTAEDYGQLLQTGAQAVRRADPQARVVFGGLAGQVSFLASLFDRFGAARVVDVVNVHSYFETWNPGALEHIPAYVGSVADVVKRHGRGQGLWAAEVGYSDFREGHRVSDWYTARFSYEHTLDFQAVALMRTLALLLAQPSVDLVAWYELKDPPDTDAVIGDAHNRHLGIAFGDRRPKPALQALAFANRLFANGFTNLPSRIEASSGSPSDAVAHAFRLADGRTLAMAWLPTNPTFAPSASSDPTGQDPRREIVDITVSAAGSGPARLYDARGSERGTLPTNRAASHTKINGLELVGGDVQLVELPAP